MSQPRTQLPALCSSAVLALLALAPGCGPIPMPRPAAGSPISLTELAQSTWHAMEIEGQSVKGAHPVLVFDSRKFVSGTGGCNTYSGPVASESVGVKFGPLAVTRRACEAPLMDLEQRYFAALAKPVRLESDMDMLYLVGDDGKVAVRFMRFFPPDDDTGP